MNNKKLLSKLLKIAKNQQKSIISIAQLSNDIEYIKKFIKNSIALWLVNNGIIAKEQFSLEQIDSNSYYITIQLSPATKTPLSESVVNKLKDFLTAKIQIDPNLKSKSIDLDVQTLPL
jgi:hypothetical protein